jgi:hypothetical protein
VVDTPSCPQCGGRTIKDGIVGDKRVYRCKACNKHFSRPLNNYNVLIGSPCTGCTDCDITQDAAVECQDLSKWILDVASGLNRWK